MAENNMVSFKVFLREGEASEARRFAVEAPTATNYYFMKEKLRAIFPCLQNSAFRITWRDTDGDEITITSDEDMITALTEISNSVKVLYVTADQRNKVEPGFTFEAEEPQYRGSHVVCDICDQEVTGFRYKCLQCPNYDLCSDCEHQGHHSEHLMIRISNNDIDMPRCARKFMHHVAKTLKKSAHAANREAHRAAKFAHKIGGHGKCNAQGGQQPREQTQSGCNMSGPQQEPLSNPMEAIDLNDVRALITLAKEQFFSSPLVENLRMAQKNGESTDEVVLMDIIRSAIGGIFGNHPEQHTNPPTDNQPSAHSSTHNAENTSKDTPMDVEGASASCNANTNQQNPSPSVPENNSEPGNASKPNGDHQPSAPNFLHHENPKIAEGLAHLHEMGFTNEGGLMTHLLECHNGNVALVLKAILDMDR